MKKAAFTLIELIVAVSIIAIITGIFLANYFGGEPQSQIINATSALMRDLRLVQTRSTASVNYGSVIPNGWGIYLPLEGNGYTIFADLSGGTNHVYDGAVESAASKGGRTVTYPEGISSIVSFGSGNMNVTFYHDSDILRVNFDDGGRPFVHEELTITLTEASTGLVKHVYVNSYGLISSDL